MAIRNDEINDIVTFFLYGLGGMVLFCAGIIFLVISPFVPSLQNFSQTSIWVIGAIFIIAGIFLRFKYHIRKKAIYVRK
ncbi:MAG: hypothetical protein Q7S74_05920 [Nanoarchaeota archaeon]|nr:hypothetical protein [Nanoarchaeota archaeon]